MVARSMHLKELAGIYGPGSTCSLCRRRTAADDQAGAVAAVATQPMLRLLITARPHLPYTVGAIHEFARPRSECRQAYSAENE